MKKFYIFYLFVIVNILFSTCAFAHQPRIVDGDFIKIENPEVSQAFYGELKGTSTIYEINSNTDFNLYVGILVPDIKNINKDILVEIYQTSDTGKKLLTTLDGRNFKWTPFYEEFGKDNYLWGPEFKSSESEKGAILKGKEVSAGKYIIKVFSPTNNGKYTLVTGYKEEFPLNETLNAIIKIPQIKLFFFNESFIKIFSSIFIWLPTILILVFIAILYFLIKYIKRKIQK